MPASGPQPAWQADRAGTHVAVGADGDVGEGEEHVPLLALHDGGVRGGGVDGWPAVAAHHRVWLQHLAAGWERAVAGLQLRARLTPWTGEWDRPALMPMTPQVSTPPRPWVEKQEPKTDSILSSSTMQDCRKGGSGCMGGAQVIEELAHKSSAPGGRHVCPLATAGFRAPRPRAGTQGVALSAPTPRAHLITAQVGHGDGVVAGEAVTSQRNLHAGHVVVGRQGGGEVLQHGLQRWGGGAGTWYRRSAEVGWWP